MASLDGLPADQKAVLSMVLQRGKTYDEIGAMLSLDRARVRQRALAAFDALGPRTSLDPLRRSLITDYLLDQLPERVATGVRESLAAHPAERAWARVIAGELAPLVPEGLPEIPSTPARERGGIPAAVGETTPPRRARPAEPVSSPSSRRGGAILLGLVVVVIVAVVVLVLVSGGSSSSTPSGSRTGRGSGTQTTATTAAAQPQVLHKIDLVSPSGSASLKGAADVVRVKGQLGLVLIAVGLAPDTTRKFAYAVWLKNAQTGAAKRLGFYNQLVAATGATAGKLEAEVKLDSGLSSYDQVLLTQETKPQPTSPGTIVLQGAFAE